MRTFKKQYKDGIEMVYNLHQFSMKYKLTDKGLEIL